MTDPTSLYSAGAAGREGEKLVLRMTYIPAAGGVTCFDDDAYQVRVTPKDMTLLMDEDTHCFYEREEAEVAAKAGTLPENALALWTRIE